MEAGLELRKEPWAALEAWGRGPAPQLLAGQLVLL